MDETMKQRIESLERTLEQQTHLHEQLLELMARKRAALRLAQDRQLAEIGELENEKLRAIGELEKQRLEQVGELTLQLQPGASAPLHLRELAEQLPEPTRGRLLMLRQQLRERMARVQRQSSITRSATESLARHMQGLVQTIGMIATGVSTYNGQGSLPEQATAVRTINMTA